MIVWPGFPSSLSGFPSRPTCEPLDFAETVKYIYFRLQKAGATKSLFSKEALEFIYQASEGIPRRINSICDLCLLDASNAQIALINSAIAKKVIQEV